MTLARWATANFYRERAVLDRQLRALAAAGLPGPGPAAPGDADR